MLVEGVGVSFSLVLYSVVLVDFVVLSSSPVLQWT